MTGTPAVQPQNFDYYNYFVMCNYVFDEPKPFIENSYTYEENGVLYCASATEKGVYRYTYARNNPLMYTDPDGEFLWFVPIIGAMVGAFLNVAMNTDKIQSVGQIFAYMGIGAAAGFAGGAASAAIAPAGLAFGFGAGFAAGFQSGFVGGMVSGFINGAGNSFLQGNSFSQSIGSGIQSGSISGIISGTTSGISEGIQGAGNKVAVFSKMRSMGLSTTGTIPEEFRTPEFVRIAKRAWFSTASDPSGGYIIQNGGEELTDQYGNVHAASTIPEFNTNFSKFTGGSTVYFHKELAFSSPEMLFRHLGHELVHVSQLAALANQSSGYFTSTLVNLLEKNAYAFSNALGGNYHFKSDCIFDILPQNIRDLVKIESILWTQDNFLLTPRWPVFFRFF